MSQNTSNLGENISFLLAILCNSCKIAKNYKVYCIKKTPEPMLRSLNL